LQAVAKPEPSQSWNKACQPEAKSFFQLKPVQYFCWNIAWAVLHNIIVVPDSVVFVAHGLFVLITQFNVCCAS
jgi:hypothetical protein